MTTEKQIPEASEKPVASILCEAATAVLNAAVAMDTPPQETYYLWVPVDGHTDQFTHGRYTGEHIIIAAGATQDIPPFGFKWKPHEPDAGNVVYFDGRGWFQAPETFNVEAARAFILEQRANEFDLQFQEKYPSFEQDSWTKQETDARAYKETGKVSLFLQTLFDLRTSDEDMDAFCDSIIARADEYNTAYAKYLAETQNLRAQLKDVTSLSDFVKLSGIPPRQFFTL